jgi:hypothetical protein
MHNQNIKNFNFNKIDLRLNESVYYDFYLANDESRYGCGDYSASGDCLSAWFDFNEPAIFSGSNIISLVSWSGATSTGVTATTIGLTALDNGLLLYDKQSGDTANTGLTAILTGSTLIIPSGDTPLTLHEVSGSTGNVSYPITQITADTVGDFARLCGGFYQGYYKLDGYDYEALPVRSNGWAANFWLRPQSSGCTGTTAVTLNDLYSGNTGFFFYMGTRAENKFWNIFSGNNATVCGTGSTTFCTNPKETDVSIMGPLGLIPLDPPPVVFKEITNPFLIYGHGGEDSCRVCGANTQGSYNQRSICEDNDRPIIVRTVVQKQTNHQNPFLVYGHGGEDSCRVCGHNTTSQGKQHSICNFSGFTSDVTELDKNADIVDNAIGFRIREDGSIGYRSLTVTGYCSGNTYVTGVTINEEYSASGMVNSDVWSNITVRWRPNAIYNQTELNCGDRRTGTLMFYVNCRLVFKVDEFDEFIARRLKEYKEKQVGVPFNFSIGGGTQGLLESMTFDGQDPDDLGLKIEQNFTGTFIGDLSQFRFYTCDKSWGDLKAICIDEGQRYNCNFVDYAYSSGFNNGELIRKPYAECGYWK